MFSVIVAVMVAQNGPAVGAGVEAARALLGVSYDWGGRLRKSEGLDCMAIVLAAAERASGCGWRSYPVKPTELVEKRLWGTRVAGLDPIATEALSLDALATGDVLMLVGAAVNPAEPSIGTLGSTPVWVWHVGLYLGGGSMLVGDHHEGQVAVVELLSYLRKHEGEFSGVFVTRGPAVRPTPCRKHAPLTKRTAR